MKTVIILVVLNIVISSITLCYAIFNHSELQTIKEYVKVQRRAYEVSKMEKATVRIITQDTVFVYEFH
jgi:uncharacterized protein YxeA